MYYNHVGEAIPEPTFEVNTDLELHAPVGVYALCTAAVCIFLTPPSIRTHVNGCPRCDVPYKHTLPANISPQNRGSTKSAGAN